MNRSARRRQRTCGRPWASNARTGPPAGRASICSRQDVPRRAASPAGRRLLLGADADASIDTAAVMGALSEHVHAEDGYHAALECVLRAWLDAIVVRDEAAGRALLAAVRKAGKGSARMLAAALEEPAPAGPRLDLPRLADRVSCTDAFRPLLDRLLGCVYLVEDLDTIPVAAPGARFVTADGAMVRQRRDLRTLAARGRRCQPARAPAPADRGRTGTGARRTRSGPAPARTGGRPRSRATGRAGRGKGQDRPRSGPPRPGGVRRREPGGGPGSGPGPQPAGHGDLRTGGPGQGRRFRGASGNRRLRVRLDEMRERRDQIRKDLTDDTETLHALEQGRNELRSVVTEKRRGPGRTAATRRVPGKPAQRAAGAGARDRGPAGGTRGGHHLAPGAHRSTGPGTRRRPGAPRPHGGGSRPAAGTARPGPGGPAGEDDGAGWVWKAGTGRSGPTWIRFTNAGRKRKCSWPNSAFATRPRSTASPASTAWRWTRS